MFDNVCLLVLNIIFLKWAKYDAVCKNNRVIFQQDLQFAVKNGPILFQSSRAG